MTHEELIEELKKIGMLHESGVLSKTEFIELKQKLLDQVIEPGNTEQGKGSDVAEKPIENINQGELRGQKEDVLKRRPSLKVAGIIIGVFALVAIAFFVYMYITHESTQKVSTEYDSIPAAVEAIEVKDIEEEEKVDEKVNTDETFFYEGQYSIFGLEGIARYSYRIDDALNTVLDGTFEFDEGYFRDDGTFDGTGSGVAHIKGQFKNGKQQGEWEIGSAHGGFLITFRDGVPDGKFEWSFWNGYGSGESKGTYRNGKLVGDFICEETDDDSNIYIKGTFDSRGKPKGIWEELREGGDRRWYIMDKAAAEESGAQGMTDGNYIYQTDLYLTERIPDISKYVLSKKVMKQNLQYPTYWKE